MDAFLFLWLYFAISLSVSFLIFALYLALLRYGKLIRRSDAAKATVAAVLFAASLTFLWYSISTTLTIFNKWLMTQWHGGFKYPLLTSTTHMLVKLLVSRLWLLYNKAETTTVDSWDSFFSLIAPIGVLTSLDISLSNASLVYIPVSLYTTVKSSVLVYTFLFSVYLELEALKLNTFLSIFAMMLGLSVAVLATKHISLYGVSLCLGASFTGALRWVLMHYYMKMHMKHVSVMEILYKISPIAFLSLLPMAVMIEGPELAASSFMTSGTTLATLAFSFCFTGGVLATVLIFVEIVLLAATSSLTLTVLGQIKEIIQIVLSMIVFNDDLTVRSVCGIIFSLLAANNYRKIKMQEMSEIISAEDLDSSKAKESDEEEDDKDVEQRLLPRNEIGVKVLSMYTIVSTLIVSFYTSPLLV